MKKISIFLILLTLIYANDAKIKTLPDGNYQELDKLFDAINKKRYGLSREKIDATKNPFLIQKAQKKPEKSDKNSTTSVMIVYTLHAIMNNKANINGKWYSINEKINDYKLKKIDSDSVIMDNVGNELKLTLEKGNENVTIKAY